MVLLGLVTAGVAAENQEIRTSNDMLENRVEKLTGEKEILAEKINTLKNEIDGLNVNLEENAVTIDGFSETNSNLTDKNIELELMIDQLEAEIDRLNELSVSAVQYDVVEETQPQISNTTIDNVSGGYAEMTVTATAYSTNEAGLSDYTATGINLRETPNVIAVDPSVIPLGSTVIVEGYGTFIAGDTGGAIVGSKIDIHMTDLNACYLFGVQSVNIKILN